jgi:hypothetical protein
VEEEQTEETLGTLLKIPGFAAGAAENISENGERKDALERQVLIMYGFTNRRLEAFLQNMKRAGMPSIPLKAIVTPHNVNWTFRALYEELEREDEAMRKRRQK